MTKYRNFSLPVKPGPGLFPAEAEKAGRPLRRKGSGVPGTRGKFSAQRLDAGKKVFYYFPCRLTMNYPARLKPRAPARKYFSLQP
jgi:hypothetical protein